MPDAVVDRLRVGTIKLIHQKSGRLRGWFYPAFGIEFVTYKYVPISTWENHWHISRIKFQLQDNITCACDDDTAHNETKGETTMQRIVESYSSVQ